MIKRQKNYQNRKLPPRIPKKSDNIYNSTLLYLKFLLVWAAVLLADFLLDVRFEYLWPVWLFLQSVHDTYKYQGLAFSLFFIALSLTSDIISSYVIPDDWIFFLASSYVWVQYVWHTERGICFPTVALWFIFVYIEAAVRLKDLSKDMSHRVNLCRPFAAHSIGYPVVTLGFGFKSYISFKLRLRKQLEVRKENEFYYEILKEALPKVGQPFLYADEKQLSNGITPSVSTQSTSTPFPSIVSLFSPSRSNDDDRTTNWVDTHVSNGNAVGAGAGADSSTHSNTQYNVNSNLHQRNRSYDSSNNFNNKHNHTHSSTTAAVGSSTTTLISPSTHVQTGSGCSPPSSANATTYGGTGSTNATSQSGGLTHSNSKTSVAASLNVTSSNNQPNKSSSSLAQNATGATTLATTAFTNNSNLSQMNNLNISANRGGGTTSDTAASSATSLSSSPNCNLNPNNIDTRSNANINSSSNSNTNSQQQLATHHSSSSLASAGGSNATSNTSSTNKTSNSMRQFLTGASSSFSANSNVAAASNNNTLSPERLKKEEPAMQSPNGIVNTPSSSGNKSNTKRESGGKKSGAVSGSNSNLSSWKKRSLNNNNSSANSNSTSAVISNPSSPVASFGSNSSSTSTLVGSGVNCAATEPNNNSISPSSSLDAIEKIEKLEMKIKSLSADLSAKSLINQELSSKISTLTSSEKHSKQEIDQLRNDKKHLEEKVTDLTSQKNMANQKVEIVERKLEIEKKAKVEAEKRVIEEKNKAKRTIEEEHAKFISDMVKKNECTSSNCSKRVKELETERNQLQIELARKNERMMNVEQGIETLRVLRDELSEKGREIARVQELNSRLENNLSMENKYKMELFSALNDCNRKINNYQMELTSKNKEIMELQLFRNSYSSAGPGPTADRYPFLAMHHNGAPNLPPPGPPPPGPGNSVAPSSHSHMSSNHVPHGHNSHSYTSVHNQQQVAASASIAAAAAAAATQSLQQQQQQQDNISMLTSNNGVVTQTQIGLTGPGGYYLPSQMQPHVTRTSPINMNSNLNPEAMVYSPVSHASVMAAMCNGPSGAGGGGGNANGLTSHGSSSVNGGGVGVGQSISPVTSGGGGASQLPINSSGAVVGSGTGSTMATAVEAHIQTAGVGVVSSD